jgi:hypothetical protein
MIVSHTIRRAIASRCSHIRLAMAIVACLGCVAACAAAETDRYAVGALQYPAAMQPAYDSFGESPATEAVGQAQYISPGEPRELPLESSGQEQPRAICDAARERPPGQLTIDIQTPAGEVPQDHAAECWPEIAGLSGENPLVRCWPRFCYRWNATCLAYQPLYFEEINLERHGYGLGYLCQPVVSGAHFFGTVPCLPYLMAVNPPGECIYTLGHYRPGSCPPWQRHWPPASAVGTLSEAGVVTGLVFLIP